MDHFTFSILFVMKYILGMFVLLYPVVGLNLHSANILANNSQSYFNYFLIKYVYRSCGIHLKLMIKVMFVKDKENTCLQQIFICKYFKLNLLYNLLINVWFI